MEKKFEVSEFALEAVRHFEFSGTLINVRPFGNGHINDTYLAEYDIFGIGVHISSLQGHLVMIFQRIQNSFMRVRMHLVISSSCCLITRRKHCTKLL